MATTDKTKYSDAIPGNGQAEEVKRRAAAGASSAHDTVERVAERAHGAVDSMAGAASRTAENLGERGEQLGEYADQAAATARSYLHEHPLATIGIAVAAGFLLSKLLSSGE